MSEKVTPIPAGYHTLTPYLIIRDAAQAIEFYKQAFGAEEIFRMPMSDGRIGHAEMRIGDSMVMLADEMPEEGYSSPHLLNGTTVSFMVYVADVDAAFQRAVDAGAKVLRPVKDQFYGDRTGTLADPFGHVWSIGTHIRDVTFEEVQQHLAAQQS